MVEISYIGKCLLVEVDGKRILVVGDLHLGYEEALNISGVGVGRKLFGEMMEDFEEIFSRTGNVDEVVLLGDVKHVFGTVLGQEREDFQKLLEFFGEKCKKIVIVQGNHDALKRFLVRENSEVRNFYCTDGVCFLHGDRDFGEIYSKEVEMWVMGHAHPAIVLEDGVKSEKYKCFLEGKFEGRKIIVVPSFSEHSVGSDVRNSDLGLAWKLDLKKFRIWVVGEKLEVMDFGEMGRL